MKHLEKQKKPTKSTTEEPSETEMLQIILAELREGLERLEARIEEKESLTKRERNNPATNESWKVLKFTKFIMITDTCLSKITRAFG
jgi:molecular chaperone GrpE (heat shock protein)